MKRNFKKNVTLIFIYFVINSCISSKAELFKGVEDLNKARKNIIFDFAGSYKTPRNYMKERGGKPFDVFWVFEKETKSNQIFFSISPEINGNIPLGIDDTLGNIPKTHFPNNYEIRENKLFLWKDNSTPLKKDVLDVMAEFGVLDSVDVKRELNLLPIDFEDMRVVTIDHKLKSVHYYICKNKIEKFKKIVTNKAVGYYVKPQLNCK